VHPNGEKTAASPRLEWSENSLADLPVRTLIAGHPALAPVLEEHGIEYCRGVKATLQEACHEKNIAVEEIVQQLLAVDRNDLSEPDWTGSSLRELAKHIVDTYHQPLRKELSRLIGLAEKVARFHGKRHPEMIQLLRVLNSFRQQLELHMEKEELILFPAISGIEAGGNPKAFGCRGGIEHPIEVMKLEHDDADEAILKMRKLTNNYAPPADACNTFKVLLFSLAKLEMDMHQHVQKENNVLFPRALALTRAEAVQI
jgi:regulator of cell morphogenesis and NO signaling